MCKKAFDTVDHAILLMKLEALGLSPDVIRWFRLYLSDRQQLVDLSGTQSSYANISCGVPQGSIVGPLLFLIYVDDMSGAISNKLLYADESAIFVSDRNVFSIEVTLQRENEVVSDWLIENKLPSIWVKQISYCLGQDPS